MTAAPEPRFGMYRVWRIRALRPLRRLVWWFQTVGCDCHWQEPYGEVVVVGCERHD